MCVTHFTWKIGIYYSFLQCVDAFVDEIWWEEQDSTKCDKICELKFTSEEWVWVNTFLGLLSVCLIFHLCLQYQILMLLSMQIMLNRPFHLTMSWLFIWWSQHLKLSTGHGLVRLTMWSIHHLPLPFMLHVRRSMSTMRRPWSLLCISWQWVWIFAHIWHIIDMFLVLNPKEKLGYFKKHWSSDLQEDVVKCIKEVVWVSSSLLISGTNLI